MIFLDILNYTCTYFISSALDLWPYGG